jgi:hypothetical protein
LRTAREALLAAIVALLLRHYVALPLKLAAGWSLIDRLAYRWREPRIGELVAFALPDDPDRIALGRITALPLEPLPFGSRGRVPAAHYICLSEDPHGRRDSRRLGPIPRLYLLGPLRF